MQASLDELSRYRASSADVTIVVLEDEPRLCDRVADVFGDSVRVMRLPRSGAVSLLEDRRKLGVVLVDVTPGTPEWDEWLVRSGALCSHRPVALVSGDAPAPAIVEAFRAGVADVLVEPLDDGQLRSAVDRLVTRRALRSPESPAERWAAAALAAVKPAHSSHDPDDLLRRALLELMRLTSAAAGAILTRDEGEPFQHIPVQMRGGESRVVSDEEIALVLDAPTDKGLRFVSNHAATGNHRWTLLAVPLRGVGQRTAILVLRVGETTRRRLQFEGSDVAFFTEEIRRAWEAAQLQQLIHAAKREYESIVDSTTDCLLLLDPGFRIRRVNRATAEALGRSFVDILGRPFSEVYPDVKPVESGSPSVEDFLRKAAASRTRSWMEVTGLLAPSDIYEVHAYPGPETEGGRLTVLFVKDVGDVRRLQRRLIQSEKLASLGTLAAGVAHEINNPVGYVKSNLNRLQEYLAAIATFARGVHERVIGTPPATAQELREVVRWSTDAWSRLDIEELLADGECIFTECFEGLDHVGVIVSNLKQYAASGAPKEPDLQLKHVAEGALRLVWNKLKYDVEVDRRFGDAPPIVGSSVELMQVLVNLLVNAADATEGKNGKLCIETRAEERDGEDGAAVLVSDNGSGIDPQKIDRIFDPFFTTKPPGRGTGLGLAISAEILHRHGAHVDVESRPGEGTTFHIWFPTANATESADD